METALFPGVFYHIYNRGNNREDLFREPQNYKYFLSLYTQHVTPLVDTFAYCLLKNHFHLLVRIKESSVDVEVSQQFSNFFNAYSKAYNRLYERIGALFQRPFKRIAVTRDPHLLSLVTYIHLNPEKHGFISDFKVWPYSSYAAILSDRDTKIARKTVLDWFGGRTGFITGHQDRQMTMELTPADKDLSGF